MPKFSVGQRVEVVHNPPTPDPRVPNQMNGKAPGRGEYPTKSDRGEIIGVVGEDLYLVAVNLVTAHGAKSVRQRHVPEAKLRAVS